MEEWNKFLMENQSQNKKRVSVFGRWTENISHPLNSALF